MILTLKNAKLNFNVYIKILYKNRYENRKNKHYKIDRNEGREEGGGALSTKNYTYTNTVSCFFINPMNLVFVQMTYNSLIADRGRY